MITLFCINKIASLDFHQIHWCLNVIIVRFSKLKFCIQLFAFLIWIKQIIAETTIVNYYNKRLDNS